VYLLRQMHKAVKMYLAKVGAKGGKTKGATKRRGDSAYYSGIAKKRKRKHA
jgi:hypothetical protein